MSTSKRCTFKSKKTGKVCKHNKAPGNSLYCTQHAIAITAAIDVPPVPQVPVQLTPAIDPVDPEPVAQHEINIDDVPPAALWGDLWAGDEGDEKVIELENKITSLNIQLKQLQKELDFEKGENNALRSSIDRMAVQNSDAILEIAMLNNKLKVQENKGTKTKKWSRKPMTQAKINHYHKHKSAYKEKVGAKYGIDNPPWQLVKRATGKAFKRLTTEEKMEYM
jgi:hypothetical protein